MPFNSVSAQVSDCNNTEMAENRGPHLKRGLQKAFYYYPARRDPHSNVL